METAVGTKAEALGVTGVGGGRPGGGRWARRGGRIFVSYRRDDTSGYAGRLYDELVERFGPSRVFRDIETIPVGSDFVEVIQSGLGSCRALVAVIGKDWLTCLDADGNRRLDDPADVLRLEVAQALGRGILVVPVLVERATMPPASRLPEDLQALSSRNALEISDDRWKHDNDRLEEVLGTVVRPGRRRLTTRKLIAGLLSLVTLLGTVLSLHSGLISFLGHAPVLGPIRGDFNIAVSRFPELLADGRVVPSAAGDSLASTLFEQLDTELRPLKDAGFVIGRRSPDETSMVQGATREERASAAGQLAGRINADVVVYGVMRTTGSETTFAPEFFLSERTLTKAEELGGQHELGSPLGSNGDLSNPVAAKLARDRLLGRIEAMTELAIGLGYYALDGHYGEALEHFEAARLAPGWDDAEGKEVLYLFLGKAAQKVGDVGRADSAFRQAVAINPEYARGRLGVAEMGFQQAKGACEEGQTDAAGLERAASDFATAGDADVKPANSDIPLKVDLALGRVYACQSQALVADRWDEAAARFGRVTAAYEAGNQRVRQLAAEAYAGLALVELPVAGAADARERLERAAVAYGKAIAASREADRTAAFYAMLAFVDDQLGRRAEADAAYANAVRLEPDPDVRQGYEDARRDAAGGTS